MSKDQYVALSSYPPPPRHSHDSDDSLRALEISEGPATNPQRIGRCILLPFPFNGGFKKLLQSGRSYSVAGFEFQRDLVRL